MNAVTVRELRNQGGDTLQRVERGEEPMVTSNGRSVARLVPLAAPAPSPRELVARWRTLPPMSYDALRADLDSALDDSL